MKKSQNQSGGKTKSQKLVESLTPINPNAAGIDIGADSHWEACSFR